MYVKLLLSKFGCDYFFGKKLSKENYITMFCKNLKLIRYLELTIPVISRLPFGCNLTERRLLDQMPLYLLRWMERKAFVHLTFKTRYFFERLIDIDGIWFYTETGIVYMIPYDVQLNKMINIPKINYTPPPPTYINTG